MRSESSELSEAYLRTLLASDPGNILLKDLLSQQKNASPNVNTHAEVNTASEMPLIPANAWDRWLQTLSSYYAISPLDSQARNAALPHVLDLLKARSDEEIAPERIRSLAQSALELGASQLAVKLLSESARHTPIGDERAEAFAAAARQALATSDYRQCSNFYMEASQAATSPEMARTHAQSAIAALQSGNYPAEALALAERVMQPWIQEQPVLQMMVRLARAAGQPRIADRYIRQLLRVSSLPNDSFLHRFSKHKEQYEDRAYLIPGKALHRVSDRRVDLTESTHLTGRWNPETFQLAYDVFLENRKLDDAWQIAKTAVRHAPKDMDWQTKLARVSEWTQRPGEALQAWLNVARATGRDEAWQAVLRIAPGQFNDAATAEGIRYRLRNEPRNPKLVIELIAAYERQGLADSAKAYLQAHQDTPENIHMLADLAQRNGDMVLALDRWKALFQDPQHITPERAMHAAIASIKAHDPYQGLRWLEASLLQYAPKEDTANEFWRMQAELANRLQNHALAVRAYRRLILSTSSDPTDFDTLIGLLATSAPAQAAEVALLAWETHQRPQHLNSALQLYQQQTDWTAIEALLQQVYAAPPELQSIAQSSPTFWHMQALFLQQQGRLDAARSSLNTAIQLSPQTAHLQQALLWLLIDQNDAVALRQLLGKHETQWQSDPEMHDTLASAYQALSQPSIALERYLTPRIQAHQEDFLWLMNYADAMEQNQEADRAWMLRRHLLTSESRSPTPATSAESSRYDHIRKSWLDDKTLSATRRVARARLLILQGQGDSSLDTLRELLRLDREAQTQLSDAAAETALGWWLDAGEYNAVRGYLWQQYARRQATRPLWADISIALSEKDKPIIGQLLETHDERLPRYNRIHAATVIGALRHAQSAAFETQEAQPADDPLHQQLVESVMAYSDSFTLSNEHRRLDDLQEEDRSASLHLAISPRLSFDTQLQKIQRRSRSLSLLAPPKEKALDTQLTWGHNHGSGSLRLGYRESLASYFPVEFSHVWQIARPWHWRVSIGRHLPTQESTALRLGGHTDRLLSELRWQPTGRDTFSWEHGNQRYHLQTGGKIGSGQHDHLRYTHSLRLDRPTLEASAFWSRHAYQRRDPTQLLGRDLRYRQWLSPASTSADSAGRGMDYFLPENFRFYGIELYFNNRYIQEYTRSWQPFGSVSRTWHSRNGSGYSLQAGFAGSVLGADHLHLSVRWERSGLNNSGSTRALQLSYRLHF